MHLFSAHRAAEHNARHVVRLVHNGAVSDPQNVLGQVKHALQAFHFLHGHVLENRGVKVCEVNKSTQRAQRKDLLLRGKAVQDSNLVTKAVQVLGKLLGDAGAQERPGAKNHEALNANERR